VNHPSYQEMGDNKNRRVRRRQQRIGGSPINGKEEAPRIGNPSPGFVNDSELDLDGDLDVIVNSELPIPNLNKVAWNETPREPLRDAYGGQSNRVERGKTKIDPIKPVVEPPEIRTVEMTTEEQDVYALMGVTPLLKLDREVKTSKSVIINVVAPGQQATTNPPESVSESPRVIPTPRKEIAPPEPKPTPVVILEPTPEPAPETEPEVVLEILAPPEEEEVETAATANRRRRRRSSASGSD
jgi:ribonuclease E